MTDRAPSRPQTRRDLPRSRAGAFTLVEAIVVLVIMSILIGIGVVSFSGMRRGQLDRAGYPIIGAAQVDARRVANAQGLSFPKDGLRTAMASSAATADGRTLAYRDSASPDGENVSVVRGDANTVGLAVMTSMQGSWDDGTANDGHCLMAIDSLKNGTQYATMTDAIRGGVNYCGASFIVACKDQLTAPTILGGAGTSEDPYRLSSTASCTGTTAPEPLDAPKCVVAEVLPAADGVTTRSARLTWVPSANSGSTFTYTIEAIGPSTTTATGIDGGARTYVMDNLVPGATYSFKVYAVNSVGAQFGPTQSNSVLLVPASPAVNATPTPGALSLTWAQVPGAATYELTRVPAFPVTPTVEVQASTAVAGVLSYVDNTVEDGASYSYSVVAVSATQPATSQCSVPVTGGGRSLPAALFPPSVPLKAPVLTVIGDAADASAFDLSWDPVKGAQSYVIRSTPLTTAYVPTGSATSANLSKTIVDASDALKKTSYVDAGLSPAAGSTARWVTYQVGAVDAVGRVVWSNTDTGLLAPDAPVITKAAPNATNPQTALDVVWTAPATANAAGYTLSRDGVQVRGPGGTSYTNTGLVPGTEYVYVATASNVQSVTVNGTAKTVGNIATSSEYKGSTSPAVGSLTVKPNHAAGTFSVSWDTVAGATAYALEGSTDGTSWAPVTATQTTAGTTVTVIDNNGGATFPAGQVRIYRMTATGAGSSYARPVAAALAPAYPTVTASIAAGSADVSLAAASKGATSITVADTTGRNVTGTNTVNATGVSFAGVAGGLPMGQWAKFGAKASLAKTVPVGAFGPYAATSLQVKADSSSAPLPAAVTTGALANVCPTQTTVVGVAYPTSPSSSTIGCAPNGAGVSYAAAVTPVNLTATTGRHQLSVTWKNAQAVTTYQVYRSTGATSDASTLLASTTANPYVDATTTDGTTYTYAVSPVVPDRVATAASKVMAGTTVPPTPVLTLARVDNDSMLASFAKVASATGYIVVPVGTDPVAYVGNLDVTNGQVVYYSGPKTGKQSIPVPAGAAVSVTINDLPLEVRHTFQVYAVNATGMSDVNQAQRCTAPLPTTGTRQDQTYKSSYGNQISLIVQKATSPCVEQLTITRKDLSTGATSTDVITGVNGLGFKRYTANPVKAGVTYEFAVTAQGEGGSAAPNKVQASAYSSYDVLIQKHNPDLYFTFDEGPGKGVIRNCANADCAVRSSSDAAYDLNLTSSSLARLKSPFAVSGYDPVNYSADFKNASKIAAVDKDYAWPGSNFTLESWVFLTSGNQIGIIVGWGDQDCSGQHQDGYKCNGGAMGLGGEGVSSSSGSLYYGYSSGVWGRALTGFNKWTSNGSGAGGGTRLDPNDGERASVAMTANTWHLANLTVASSGGRIEERHWVDGRALGNCTTSTGAAKMGVFVTNDYQWCTVWSGIDINPATEYFKARPSLKGITIGGWNRIAFNGNNENRFLQATIDNVAVYRRVLTEKEMRQHYKTGALFMTTSDPAGSACIATAACYKVTGALSGGTVVNGVRKLTVRDKATFSAVVTGRLLDGSTAIDTKPVTGLTAELEVRDENGIFVTPNPDGVTKVVDTVAVNDAAQTSATFTLPAVGWSKPGTYVYRTVIHTPFGDQFSSWTSLAIAP